MENGFLRRTRDLFLKIHYLAIIYAILLVPLFTLGAILKIFVGPFVALAFFIPIGPISITIHGAQFLDEVFEVLNPFYNPLLTIAIAVSLKCVIYAFLQKSKLINRSAILVLLTTTFVTCSIWTLVWRDLTGFTASLALTVPIDLTALSYVKYRDAVNGTASMIWIPVLPILWSLMIWAPLIISLKNPGEWPYWMTDWQPIPLAVIITIWVAITAFQATFSIKYFIKVKSR